MADSSKPLGTDEIEPIISDSIRLQHEVNGPPQPSRLTALIAQMGEVQLTLGTAPDESLGRHHCGGIDLLAIAGKGLDPIPSASDLVKRCCGRCDKDKK